MVTTVLADPAAGEGVWSSGGRAAPACVPAIPAVVGASATSVTVTVVACPYEAAVDGYRLRAFGPTGTTSLASADVPVGSAQVTVDGLAAGSVYRFALMAFNGDGEGGRAGFTPIAIPPFSTAAAFTRRQHLDFADREPSASEISNWASRLANGTLTPAAAIESLHRAAYWQKQSPVIRLFQAFFLRLPDLSGLDYWVGRSRSGTRIAAIASSFAGSSEFKNRYGTLSNRAFVLLVYQNVLGRPGDPGGIDYWTGQLDRNLRKRGEVMVGFSESNEYENKTNSTVDVVNITTAMLRRIPTAGQLADWKPLPSTEIFPEVLDLGPYEDRVTGVVKGITSISAGTRHSCAVTGGRVICWGWNLYGQLGDGTKIDRANPVFVPGLTGVKAVSAGGFTTCALLADGTVRCWGAGFGVGTSSLVPVAVPGLSGVAVLEVGPGGHACALLTNATVKCWGSNLYGALGNGDPAPTNQATPVTVSGLLGVSQLVVGGSFACALVSGKVRCWGRNFSGELGDGTEIDRNAPVTVREMGPTPPPPGFAVPQDVTGVQGIGVAFASGCAVVGGGSLKCWGSGSGGDRTLAKPLPGLTDVVALTGGTTHQCARVSDGTVRCWGVNSGGVLGDGTTENRSVPTQVVGLSGVAQVDGGSAHNCARLTDGTARCWGVNDKGSVGDGSTTNRSTPRTVTFPT